MGLLLNLSLIQTRNSLRPSRIWTLSRADASPATVISSVASQNRGTGGGVKWISSLYVFGKALCVTGTSR